MRLRHRLEGGPLRPARAGGPDPTLGRPLPRGTTRSWRSECAILGPRCSTRDAVALAPPTRRRIVSEPAQSPDSVDPSLEALVTQTLGEVAAGRLAELAPVLVRDLADIDWRVAEVLGSTYAQLTEAARYACSTGGKRVRPLLMASAYRALGATSTQPIHSLAAAFQLIHTATLVHDDVIDHAETRRGRAVDAPGLRGAARDRRGGLPVRSGLRARGRISPGRSSCRLLASRARTSSRERSCRRRPVPPVDRSFSLLPHHRAKDRGDHRGGPRVRIAEIGGATRIGSIPCRVQARALGMAFQSGTTCSTVYGDPICSESRSTATCGRATRPCSRSKHTRGSTLATRPVRAPVPAPSQRPSTSSGRWS